MEKEWSGTALSSLCQESGVVSGKILKSLSVTQQTVVTLLEKPLAQF